MSGGGNTDVKPSKQEKTLAQDAVKSFNDHRERFVPLENSFISEMKLDSGQRREGRGIQTSSVAQGTGHMDREIVTQSRGQTGEGKNIMARSNMASAIGEARAGAATGSDMALRQRELAGYQKMMAFGRELEDTSSLTLADAGRNKTQANLGKVQNSMTKYSSTMSGLGQMAGAASGAYFDKKGYTS